MTIEDGFPRFTITLHASLLAEAEKHRDEPIVLCFTPEEEAAHAERMRQETERQLWPGDAS